MATLKDIKNKISAVKKTKQITKAMNMVAASKLRSAQGHMEAFRPYARKFAEVLGSLAERSGEGASPLLVPREDVKKIHIVLCTSDRGLCGAFNSSIVRLARDHAYRLINDGKQVKILCVGKKGFDQLKRLFASQIIEVIERHEAARHRLHQQVRTEPARAAVDEREQSLRVDAGLRRCARIDDLTKKNETLDKGLADTQSALSGAQSENKQLASTAASPTP